MKHAAAKASGNVVEHVPCVLKLAKHKFACYVERFVGHVAPLQVETNLVKIVSNRKKARRAAMAMARVCRKSSESRQQKPAAAA